MGNEGDTGQIATRVIVLLRLNIACIGYNVGVGENPITVYHRTRATALSRS